MANEIRERARPIFDAFATGPAIPKDTFPTLVRAMGLVKTKQELDELWIEVDEDGSGAIEFEELCTMFDRHYNPEQEDEAVKKMYEAFKVLDADGDGNLTLDELKQMMMQGGEPLSDEEWESYEDFFRRADRNNKGFLLCFF